MVNFKMIVVMCLSTVLTLNAKAQKVDGEIMRWNSPDKKQSVVLLEVPIKRNEPPERHLVALKDGQSENVTESKLLNSPITREFAGMWMDDGEAAWFENRYLVLQGDRRLCILDAQAKLLLINTSFEAFSKSPEDNVWAAIRYRPVGRHQDSLSPQTSDTLFVIDLPRVIEATASIGYSDVPYSHVQSLKLPGIAQTKPVWLPKEGGESLLAVAVWTGANVEAISINPRTIKVVDRRPLDVQLNNDVVYGIGIDANAESVLIKAMESVFKEVKQVSPKPAAINAPDLSHSELNRVPEPKSEQRIETSPVGKDAAPKGQQYVGWIAVIAAGIGLLWLKLKK
jgi:hypothetical protein